jgi:hypothetical protein
VSVQDDDEQEEIFLQKWQDVCSDYLHMCLYVLLCCKDRAFWNEIV